jgi:hypothetical protein
MFGRSFIAMAFAVALPFSVSASSAFAQSAPAAPAASATAVPAPAAAATTATAPAIDVRAACKADMDKLCPNVERGDARRSCIETNKDKFSDSCEAARNAARDAGQDRREAFRAACAGDVAKLCADVEKGKGRVIDCMRGHADKLTPSCKTELTNLSGNSRGGDGADQTKKQ